MNSDSDNRDLDHEDERSLEEGDGEPGPEWLQKWTGRRFYPRFRLAADRYDARLLLIRASPRAFWFDQNWELFFPLHPEVIPSASKSRDTQTGYISYPADTVRSLLDDDLTETEALAIAESTEGPFLVAELYTPTVIDPDVHVLHTLRDMLVQKPGFRGHFNQRTAVYAFPELAAVQKDYISEFLHLMRDQLLACQDEELEDSHPEFDPEEFDFREASFPRPRNPLLEQHVRKILIDMSEDTWYLIFCYDVSSFSEYEEAPEQIEIMASVPLDDDDEPQSEDADHVSTKDGTAIVFYQFCLQQIR